MIRPAASGPTNVPRLSPSAPAVFALTSSDGLAATAGSSVRTVGRTSAPAAEATRDGGEHEDRGVGEAGRGDERGAGRPHEVGADERALGAAEDARVDEQVDDRRRDHPRQRDEAHERRRRPAS